MLTPYLRKWDLVADGEPIITASGRLLPVRRGSVALMLKRITDAEERRGVTVLNWWNGEGAVRLLAHDASAVLMERATDNRSLANMARTGDDAEACRILCGAARRLHAPRSNPPEGLVDLSRWFASLWPFAAAQGGLPARCADVARELLSTPRDPTVLHGDLHHDNVRDFGARGWLAIDAKGLCGERGFDFANIFTNPDYSDHSHPVATQPARFQERIAVVAAYAQLDRVRLLRWVLAWAGLSAAWFVEDGRDTEIALTVAAMAAAALDA